MTLYFANHEIIILRSRRRGATDKWSISATYTAMPATVEPVTPERAQLYNLHPAKTYTAFVSTDFYIREGDRIITLNDNGQRDKTYEVKGVSYWAGSGLLDHQELTLTSEQSNA